MASIVEMYRQLEVAHQAAIAQRDRYKEQRDALLARAEAVSDRDDAATEDMVSLIKQRDALLARVEAAEKACNLCQTPWPNHAEACAYRQTAEALEAAEKQFALEREENERLFAANNDLRELREAAEEREKELFELVLEALHGEAGDPDWRAHAVQATSLSPTERVRVKDGRDA